MARIKYAKLNDDSAEVDMTPMLDIVFIMLIFFIVTAVFLDERGLDLTTPMGKGPDGGGNTIQIYVDAQDRVSVDRVQVMLKGVPSRVERLLADKPDANIVLMVDRAASLDPIIYIKDNMNMASRNTIVKVIRQ